MYSTTFSFRCAVCGEEALSKESRMLLIRSGRFSCERRQGDDFPAATAAGDEARVCGQTHALILFERYLERGSFEPALMPVPQPQLDNQPASKGVHLV